MGYIKRKRISAKFSKVFFEDYSKMIKWAFRLRNYVFRPITEEEVRSAKKELGEFRFKYAEFYKNYASETDPLSDFEIKKSSPLSSPLRIEGMSPEKLAGVL